MLVSQCNEYHKCCPRDAIPTLLSIESIPLCSPFCLTSKQVEILGESNQVTKYTKMQLGSNDGSLDNCWMERDVRPISGTFILLGRHLYQTIIVFSAQLSRYLDQLMRLFSNYQYCTFSGNKYHRELTTVVVIPM